MHLDLHVTALASVLARVRAEGGIVERECRGVGLKDVAFCNAPFGHGFCVIEEAQAVRSSNLPKPEADPS